MAKDLKFTFQYGYFIVGSTKLLNFVTPVFTFQYGYFIVGVILYIAKSKV